MRQQTRSSPAVAPGTDIDEQRQWTARAVTFVRSIGLTAAMDPGTAGGPASFLPGVRVAKGGLVVAEDAFPGDVLHEAGHLATMPPPFRDHANGDLSEAARLMDRYLAENPQGLEFPEDPLCRAILQCGDAEATAWQYAAAQHIGMPDGWLFPPAAYEGEAAQVLTCLRARAYFGINGLAAAGWTAARALFARPGVPVYPELAFWLHPGAA